MGVFISLSLSRLIIFRKVFKAKRKTDGELFALKRIRIESDKEGVCLLITQSLLTW